MAQVEFYSFIATMCYLFLVSALLFFIFYKIAMLSPNKRLKNIFLFFMSLLLRIPFKPVEVTGHQRLSLPRVWKEVWKYALAVFFVTIWYLTALYFAQIQIEEFKSS
ncbi:hypothetical protein HFA01_07040 [Halobacillus faecis]|uniref:Uncharacterized protein n=1 Tax=Halobacillus faecis TaxID=360184 RepID=A0A511WT34_9BACI|nr:hypothetical protein HFA01_07040 [Halobacillus faecis]